jgi:hypothetical protein
MLAAVKGQDAWDRPQDVTDSWRFSRTRRITRGDPAGLGPWGAAEHGALAGPDHCVVPRRHDGCLDHTVQDCSGCLVWNDDGGSSSRPFGGLRRGARGDMAKALAILDSL